MSALDQLDAWPVPAAAAAVVGVDGVLATHGDVGQVFALASVTKPLAALAVLVAADEQAVDLDDPDAVQAVLGDVVPGATLRHLLAHAAGLAADRPVRAFAPATRRVYSNAGIDAASAALAHASGIDFGTYFAEAVAGPLRLSATTLGTRPSRDGRSTVADLARVASELLAPTGLLDPGTRTALAAVQFPGLRGVLPGYGPQARNDWGLGVEIRSDKTPHWTGTGNSPSTFGHFGQSGTMLWIDPVARLGLVALTDQNFDEWARVAWPVLSDAVLAEFDQR